MTKLKLSAVLDDRPVKLAIGLPAAIHRDLALYAEALAKETGQTAVEPAKLIAADDRALHGGGPSLRQDEAWQGLTAAFRLARAVRGRTIERIAGLAAARDRAAHQCVWLNLGGGCHECPGWPFKAQDYM